MQMARPIIAVPYVMAMLRRSWILLVILFCLQCFGAEDVGCTQRTVIVTARDRSGNTPPNTLQMEDLRGKINDKPVQILAATKPTNPSRVALVLDASGSMSGKWQRALEFAVEIVRESPSSTQFALVIFADNELRTVQFGKTGPEIVTEIMSFKDVRPYGPTALWDGIWEAASTFQPSREGDTIVVVSDGGDSQSKVSPSKLRETMWSRGIRVMFVQFVDPYLPNQFQSRNDADAAWLSESSGGFLSRIEDPRGLPKAAQVIAFELENYLVVRITLSKALEKPASLRLEAVDPSGRKRKNIELAFPEKLPPCASLPSKQ
jgi:Mg-chelatase subunit ChlD